MTFLLSTFDKWAIGYKFAEFLDVLITALAVIGAISIIIWIIMLIAYLKKKNKRSYKR